MKKTILIAVTVIAAAVLMSSCTPAVTVTKSQTYPEMYAEQPVAILVMPPINRSTKVEAKELFYSSLIVPLTQKGYYVMPPLLTMEILKEESAYDAEMFLNNSMKQVGSLFGVDAVLFTTIHDWSKTAIAGQVSVVVEYMLKSTKSDEVLFNRKGDITYSPNTNSGNIFADLIGNMLSAAMMKEIELGRKCNDYTIGDMPAGKYSSLWGQDGATQAGSASFSVKLQ